MNCPNAHPSTPHDMRQDDNGNWYCPIERDVILAAAWRKENGYDK